MNLPVNGSTVEFKIDTGADITVIAQSEVYKSQHCPRLVAQRNAPHITSPGEKVQCTGKFLATSQYKGQKYMSWITVITG